MPTTEKKSERVPKSITLPPEMAARLQQESDDRLLNPSVLIERALKDLFAGFDAVEAAAHPAPAAAAPPAAADKVAAVPDKDDPAPQQK